MQHKPEDRIFPYNSQTCLVRLKQIIWYYYKCIVYKTTSNINVSILDGMGTIYHVAILVLQLKPQYCVLEIGFPSGWLLIRKIDRVMQFTTAYVPTRENTVCTSALLGPEYHRGLRPSERKHRLLYISLSTKLISVDRIHDTTKVPIH